MSISRMTSVVRCPRCGTENTLSLLSNVEGDRRPEQRQAIVDRTLQQTPCESCGELIRAQPALVYFDRGQDLWIACYTWGQRAEWHAREEQAQQNFQVIYNSPSSIADRMRERPVRARVTFGWEALREKIVAAGLGLDDVTLELFKWHSSQDSQTRENDGSDLRLLDGDADCLHLGRMGSDGEEIAEMWTMSRAGYDSLNANEPRFQALRDELSKGMYVDLQRVK